MYVWVAIRYVCSGTVEYYYYHVVTYAYNIHAVRTHSTDRTVSYSSRTHHIRHIRVHHSMLINSLGI